MECWSKEVSLYWTHPTKSKILVLDIETDNLIFDIETDNLIQQTARQHFYDSTTIANRITFVVDSDMVLIFDHGIHDLIKQIISLLVLLGILSISSYGAGLVKEFKKFSLFVQFVF